MTSKKASVLWIGNYAYFSVLDNTFKLLFTCNIQVICPYVSN